MGDAMHDYLNLERWWPGTANNYWNIDDLVRAYVRVREESRIVLPGHGSCGTSIRVGASLEPVPGLQPSA